MVGAASGTVDGHARTAHGAGALFGLTAMTRSKSRLPITRRAVNLALTLGAAAWTGCGTSNWLEEKKLAPVVFPRTILPIMVFRSDYVLTEDREGVTDAIASALSSELGRYGIQTTVIDLAGAPRSPRIELAVRDFQPRGATGYPAVTVDCAYVSPGEQIAFVGRLHNVGGAPETTSGVEPIAREIAEKLTSLT